jgi:nucleotide-binding universal stress UspA family protein
MSIKTVMVPTDFRVAATEALHRATHIAMMHQAKLEIVHIIRAGHDISANDRALELGPLVDKIAEDAGKPAPAWDYHAVHADDIARAVVAAAKRTVADLIVMGTRGGGLMAGGVAERVTREASTDVLVAREGTDARWPVECLQGVQGGVRVLVAIDFSDCSRRALEVAERLRNPADSLVGLHVVERPPTGGSQEPLQVESALAHEVRRRAEKWSEGRLAEILIGQGDVADTILSVARAEKAGLIVVGATGLRDEYAKVVLGRVPERILPRAPAPVLTVR